MSLRRCGALLAVIFIGACRGSDSGSLDASTSMDAASASDSGEPADVGATDGASPDEASADAANADAHVADAGICSPTVGLIAPLPACSPETPCERPAPELEGQILITPSTPPTCPASMTLDEMDVAGFRRYACVSSPAGAVRRPLVLWFHPGGQGAETIEETGLVERAQDFHLVVIQGRNLRFPTKEPRDGRHHDFYHRDLGSPSNNPDIAFADAIVDDFVATELVDAKRIYVMGWSNGGFFGQLYAIARRNTATPGGAKVAAAAVFATANPFEDVRWDPFADVARTSDGACRGQVPVSEVPILLVYRTCDAAVGATSAQAACFDNEPGYATEPWLALATGLSITPLRIGGREPGTRLDRLADASTTIECTAPTCTEVTPACLCLVNHLIWPDGHYDNASSNIDFEPEMLAFLRDHPLP